MAALSAELKALADQLGFVRAGVARVQPLADDAARLHAWLAAGHHGTMAYMAETAEVRADIRHPGLLSEARSVLVLATPYAHPRTTEGFAPGKVARYAQGRDYHALLYDRTRPLKRLLRKHGALARSCVDTMPVLERAWAARAGVGFVGKNACVIVPGIGSHVLLTVVVTSAELAADEPIEERCGSCRLCLDACPTRAFVAPKTLDARRCISYLTIEHDGPIAETLRADMGPWLFGCDVCQDVCPYNKTKGAEPAQTAAFAPRGRWSELGAEDFLRMDAEVFDRYSRMTPLRRAGRQSMARNAAIVLGNSGDKRHLPVLQWAARHDESSVVREAAAWSIARLGSADSEE
jgi:epoxyqueuosine reductase